MTTFNTETAGMVAIVTGSGRGLGRIYAEALAAAGMKVGLLGRSKAAVDDVAANIRANGGEALAVEADVIKPDTVVAAVSQVEEAYGPVDFLVNNAGAHGPVGNSWEVDAEDWWTSIESYLRGTFLCTQVAMQSMTTRKRGRIVNIVSNAGVYRWPNLSAYSVAKAAQIKFTENVAVEAQRTGVKLFAFHPGLVDDIGMTRDALDEDASSDAKRQLVIDWMRDEQRKGRTVDAKSGAQCLVTMATGRYDGLSGRYLTVHDDLDQLSVDSRHIRRADALMLRVSDLP